MGHQDNPTSIEALGLSTRSKELILEFFWLFARFEYALKRAGYLQRRADNRASPDWERFTNELLRIPQQAQMRIVELGSYILEQPPKRQIALNGHLNWEDRPRADSDLRSVIESVKAVRNNLFHGGKFPYAPVVEPARNEQLISTSVAVLRALLAVDQPPCSSVSDYFAFDV